ncbi:tRNA ligase subunit PheS family protein [Kitasatospora sp. NBC_01266]|uniref:tRNA ligase subunit PheS family protein n=1 Tax=Kitasatospora sp. NBC_01266 TaxID=2903572 RepID=UPI002E362587|nr:hypothetical protein [Kitasatospora sp. NBC_01266]
MSSSADPPLSGATEAGPTARDGAPPEVPLDLPGVQALRDAALGALRRLTPTPDELARWERDHLGRRAPLARCRARLGELPRERRAELGKALADALRELTSAAAEPARSAAEARFEHERIDPTVPPVDQDPGGLHPITLLTRECLRHFGELGFAHLDSPWVETVAHSFDILGVPADHPTRGLDRSFYLSADTLLRSHTTASQAGVLERERPAGPMRFVVTGPCFRNGVPTPRTHTQFHQFEVVALGPQIRLSDLKGLTLGFVEDVMGPGFAPRFRFRSFPYASPGVAVDVDCRPCGTAGCELCRGSGRLEIMGGGMLVPEILRIGCDPARTRGLALAISLERVLALRHGLRDIRHFLQNDLRVLTQFVR